VNCPSRGFTYKWSVPKEPHPFLPLVDRARSFSVAPDAGGPVLYRDGRAVGRIRYGDPELTEALNLADGLARSPASIASFLEAAGAAALELAGKILVRRT
jgi:hypothetical protein